MDTPYKGKDTRTAYLTVPNVDFCIFTIHIEPLKDRTTILVTGPKVSFICTFHCTKYLIIYPSVGGGLYSNHLVCLCVCLLLDMLRKYFVLRMKQYGSGKITCFSVNNIYRNCCKTISFQRKSS